MLTTKHLKLTRRHLDGVQKIYQFPSGYGLSLVNSPMLHHYPFAWEAAVLAPDGTLDYSTFLTRDVEVFQTDREANAFIARAARVLGSIQDAS
jgi:hypothetical protein